MASAQGRDAVSALASPLTDVDSLDPVLERVADARLVLIGEASHGTSEFYNWRAALTQRLVEEKGFGFVGVEGDWPDCYELNRFVKHAPDVEASTPRDAIRTFERWPTWMWANTDVEDFIAWLRGFNEGRSRDRRVGFYGLDVYSLFDSLEEIVGYLEREGESEALEAARRAFRCFEPYGPDDGSDYARATARLVPASCENEVVDLLSTVRRRMHGFDEDPEGPFSAEQNALVSRNAERYYRAMIRGGGESWNVRDRHMMETLDRLLDFHGSDAKGVVWAHNTHVGDARFTDMADAGMTNIGTLARERHGESDTVLVGFTSHRGSVIAGRAWGAPWQRMNVPEAQRDSHEAVLHEALDGRDAVLSWSPEDAREGRVGGPLGETRGQRAIGVVYDPRFESYGNYVPTELLRRYDALLHVDESRALQPVTRGVPPEGEPPETWPSGV